MQENHNEVLTHYKQKEKTTDDKRRYLENTRESRNKRNQ
jgi:hypothetical protein